MKLKRTAATALVSGVALASLLAGVPANAADMGVQVVGGVPAAPGEFKGTMVSIQGLDDEGNWRHYCGGSVLSSRAVLTAAHCLSSDGSGAGMRVVVGPDRLSDTSNAQTRSVAVTVSHPDYATDPTDGHDIGLVFLGKDLTNVEPVKLPTPGTDSLIRPGTSLTAIGWGDLAEGTGVGSDQLMKVDVPVLDQDECAISNDGSFNSATDICAGVRGKDTCQGDSGGPLMRIVGTGSERKVYQVGVVSRGEGCAGQGAPGVYTYTGAAGLMESLWAQAFTSNAAR